MTEVSKANVARSASDSDSKSAIVCLSEKRSSAVAYSM